MGLLTVEAGSVYYNKLISGFCSVISLSKLSKSTVCDWECVYYYNKFKTGFCGASILI